ncbi:hypothetical protein ADZ37_04665 [Pannonibacter phragmitetus]|nr:tripartite tricarboxylate transporter TctB family protein [Pannonibacter phragmitetus]KND20676.1 hypothetical protein ADZ37_04665 [Pannonibacter phragmitetus]
MSLGRNKDVLTGVCMLCAGLAFFYMTAGLPRRGTVDAAFVPYALSIGMILLGAIHLVLSLRAKGALAPEDCADENPAIGAAASDEEGGGQAAGRARPDYLTVGVSLALIAVFIALMRPLGFAISAAFYLFLQFSLLSPAGRPRPHFMHAALAIGISLTIYVVFRQGFNLMLPAGPLARLMP